MDDELPEECCANCRFAAPSEIDGSVTCRRFPPGPIAFLFDRENDFAVAAQKIECYFGVTDKTDWCGEFQPQKDAKPPRNPVLDWPIRDMDVSVRCRHAMKRASRLDKQIVFVRDLVGMTADELSGIKNFGSGSLREVREWLVKHGLYLKGD